ncbi:MAG: MFS transporter [Sedimenticola sp.]|nr:MFS transporter [Sedimenticola sp.]MCW8946949.1 MFS transporter [Sedimenticola sp.]MCW8976414.1 MFS transporter [Sedimenticola sp.]MCW9021847.1 MFS transporter [Sedimenticola sp.]
MAEKQKVLWRDRRVLSWGLYDWANSAFATTVMAGLFPLFFKQYWAAGLTVSESTFMLGSANAAASLVVVIIAPLLGAIADRGSSRKRFLLYFAAMGIVMTGALFLVAAGGWWLALALYALAVVGFSSGNIFYDALLVEVSDETTVDRVSAFGFALGYLGGGLLFAVNVVMTLNPGWFGLIDTAAAVKAAFLMVAVWWALFTVPVLLFVPEPESSEIMGLKQSIKAGFGQLRDTFSRLKLMRQAWLFLLAYWLYIDGVDTIVRMAVDYGLSLGFDSNGLIIALLITQFVGFPAAILFGGLAGRWGARQGIYLAIGIYLMIILWAYQMDQIWEFYMLAIAIGLVQGGIQALSRSYYVRLIPKDKPAEFFGFYNMLGKFAAVFGPLLMGVVSFATGSPRLSILSVAILFVAGALLLKSVDEEAGKADALQLEG